MLQVLLLVVMLILTHLVAEILRPPKIVGTSAKKRPGYIKMRTGLFTWTWVKTGLGDFEFPVDPTAEEMVEHVNLNREARRPNVVWYGDDETTYEGKDLDDANPYKVK